MTKPAPKKVEKKYRVNELGIYKLSLKEHNYSQAAEKITTHYYGKRADKNVTKLVVYGDRSEIHELTESDGAFELTRITPMSSQTQGLKWLTQKGYSNPQKLIMKSTSYDLDDARVGLYEINNTLLSIIIEAKPDISIAIETMLGLQNAEQIKLPYNIYLENL